MNEQQKHRYRISINRLIFTSMNEVLHETYLGSSSLKPFDPNLLTKLRNIKAQLDRQLEKDVKTIDTDQTAMGIYHMLTNVFDTIISVANTGDPDYFEDLMKTIHVFNENKFVK